MMCGTDHFTNIELSPYKFVSHVDKLEVLARGGDVFPVTVELDLVDSCNHSCWWCVDPVHGDHSMELDVAFRVLDELRSLGVEGIVFKGGGEPTLHPDFTAILRRAKCLGFEVGVVTNGSCLSQVYDGLVLTADYVRVSIDGPDCESHHAIHGSRDFASIVEGVSLLVGSRQGRQKRHPIVGLSFAMDYSMRGFIQGALALGEGLHVDYVLLRPPFFEEVGRSNTMTPAEKLALLQDFEEARAVGAGDVAVLVDHWISDSDALVLKDCDSSPRRGQFLAYGMNGIEHAAGICSASPLLAVIAADGSVYPCCNLRAIREWSCGVIDYSCGSSFGSLWHGERRTAVMHRIHRIECIRHCTHPLSRYNEVIEYMRGPGYHRGFV